MLPKKTRYALKALKFLAVNYGTGQKHNILEISTQEHIPKKFLETILLELRNHGIVASKQGSQGGYFLNKHPEEVMLSHIIRITGGPLALIPCASLNFYESCEECLDEKTCGLRNIIIEVRDATIKVLSKNSLADIIKRESVLKKKHK